MDDPAASTRGRALRVIHAPRQYRAAWISDVHLGRRTCNAPAVLEFLRGTDCDTLYVVGDLIDFESLRRGMHWPQSHNDVIQKLLRKARKGTQIVYIPGNHDQFVSRFEGDLGNIAIKRQTVHTTVDGRKLLVMHGHELDTVVQGGRWVAFLGDIGYEFLLSLNPVINYVRRKLGHGYWSLSAYAKGRVRDAVNFIETYEEAIARYAKERGFDGVVCGHIHSAAIRAVGAMSYYNSGDWVESCSALVEHSDGRIELLRYDPFAGTGDLRAA